MSRKKRFCLVVLVLFLATLVTGLGPAVAQDFVDSLATSGDQTQIIFGNGELPPIPADFFFPGSLPYSGTVFLFGVSSDEDGNGGDVQVQRSGDPQFSSELPSFAPPVAVQAISLSLNSASSLVVESDDGFSEEWALAISLSASAQPVGEVNARLDSPEGGAFSSVLPIIPTLSFVNVADVEAVLAGLLDPSDITVRTMDFATWGLPPVELVFDEIPFSAVSENGEPGGFFPGVLPGGVGSVEVGNVNLEPVLHRVIPPRPQKRCRYQVRSTTRSTDPVCQPDCPPVATSHAGPVCQTKAQCARWAINIRACQVSGSCVYVAELVSCS